MAELKKAKGSQLFLLFHCFFLDEFVIMFYYLINTSTFSWKQVYIG